MTCQKRSDRTYPVILRKSLWVLLENEAEQIAALIYRRITNDFLYGSFCLFLRKTKTFIIHFWHVF
jgi:hypothetical protein